MQTLIIAAISPAYMRFEKEKVRKTHWGLNVIEVLHKMSRSWVATFCIGSIQARLGPI